MNVDSLDHTNQRLRWFACLAAFGIFLYYIAVSRHWIIMWDGAVMHYIVFLISHGFHPYSDITDMNMPGCYLTEHLAMTVFGWGRPRLAHL